MTKITSPLAEAQSFVRQCEEGYSAALRVQDDARIRFVEGDDTVTDAVRQDAAKAVDWAAARLTAAREALATAEQADERERAMASPDVASMIVDLLKDNARELHLSGIPVEVAEPPAASDAMTLPQVVVVQRRVTKWDGLTGLGKGEAVVYLYSHADGPILDSTEILAGLQKQARDQGIATLSKVGGRTFQHGQVSIYATTIAAADIRPEVPALSGEPPQHVVNVLSSMVRDAVQERPGLFATKGVGIGSGFAGGRVSRVRCSTDKPRHVDAKTIRGMVRRTYEVDLSTFSQELDGDGLRDNMIGAVASLAGRFVERVGRIESAAVDRTSIRPVGQYDRGREATARLVLVSRVA